MKAKFLVGLLLLALPDSAFAAAPPALQNSAFIDQVRTLLMLQDLAAAGNRDAPALEKKIIVDIAAAARAGQLPKADDTREANAAIALTLSGGPPGIAEALLKSGELPALQARVLEGAVAFKRGDAPTAARLLRDIDPVRLPQSMGGRVALMQAMLAPDKDIAKRRDLLALAAALMPGTLVEDAALRRAAALAAVAADPHELWRTAGRYLRRMGASLYAKPFVEQTAVQVLALARKDKPIDATKLDELFNLLRREDRLSVYLGLAKQATASGLQEFAQFAAARARRLATEGSPSWQRANLYDAAWAIAGPDYERTAEKLKGLNGELLPADDRPLLNTALDVAARIRADRPAGKEIIDPAEMKSQLPQEQAQLVTAVGSAVADADKLLRSLATP